MRKETVVAKFKIKLEGLREPQTFKTAHIRAPI
jgi:hypothetical protein